MSTLKPESAANNNLGIIGLLMAGSAALLSPLIVIAPFPFAIAVPLALGGVIVCIISLFRRPRRYGLVGVLISMSCLGGWAGFVAYIVVLIRQPLARYDITIMEYVHLLKDSQSLTHAIEAHRARRQMLPQTLEDVHLSAELLTDPWSRGYMYNLSEQATYGYQIMSAGKDGLPGTIDDIDVLALERHGTFSVAPPPSN